MPATNRLGAKEIQEAAYQIQREIIGVARRRRVNKFRDDSGPRIPILRVDPAPERDQVERLCASQDRRPAACRRAGVGGRAAAGSENLMPAIVECVDRGVTLGEISDALRDIFGEHREQVVV